MRLHLNQMFEKLNYYLENYRVVFFKLLIFYVVTTLALLPELSSVAISMQITRVFHNIHQKQLFMESEISLGRIKF